MPASIFCYCDQQTIIRVATTDQNGFYRVFCPTCLENNVVDIQGLNTSEIYGACCRQFLQLNYPNRTYQS